jgi:hypothetical protein
MNQPPVDMVNEVVIRYHRYLKRNGLLGHLNQYSKREKADPSSAEAEAVMFSWLRAEERNPSLNEDISHGGPDFICTLQAGEQFHLEVTSLDKEAVARKSSLPNEIHGLSGGAFSLVTEKLKSKAKDKAKQLAGKTIPGVLAITSDHLFASMVMDQLAADYLMTSETQLVHPLDGSLHYMATDLKNAVFHQDTGILNASGTPVIKPSLQSIAAILLVAIDLAALHVVGLLNTEAVRPFDPAWLPGVPFVKGTVYGGKIRTEWVQRAGQNGASFQHRVIA